MRLTSLSQRLSEKYGINYRALMKVERPEARSFYEVEAENNKWSGRELERQIGALLFDRLLLSKDKKGQEINPPSLLNCHMQRAHNNFVI